MTLNEHQAAEYVGVSVHTLRKWRSARKGPRFVKLRGKARHGRGDSGRVLYREEDLRSYLDEMTIPTENPMPESGRRKPTARPLVTKVVDFEITAYKNNDRATPKGSREAPRSEEGHEAEPVRGARARGGSPPPFEITLESLRAACLDLANDHSGGFGMVGLSGDEDTAARIGAS